jgi:hypothetical protein
LRKVLLLGSGEFDSAPMIASPGIPAEQVKILRDGYAKGARSRSHRGSEEGLEPELIHGDEMDSLAKEVMVQPSELIALMKEVMEHRYVDQ